jgi:hypothetical protein
MREWGLCSGNAFIFIFTGKIINSWLMESRQCPLVLVNTDRKKDEVLGEGEGSMLRNGLLEASSGEKR